MADDIKYYDGRGKLIPSRVMGIPNYSLQYVWENQTGLMKRELINV